MFERYSERARRVLFFARYELMQTGGRAIEPEHLVLGVLRDNAQAVLRFARAGETADTIRKRLEPAIPASDRVATSAEVPFSPSCQDALAHTPIAADDLNNQWIRPEHIILGVMVKTDGAAARTLRDAGVEVKAIREYLRVHAGDKDNDHDRASGAHSPPRVARQWRGVVKPALASQYIRHLQQETLSVLHDTPGFVHATIMHRDVQDGTEFVVTTYWQSLEAIKAFAGEDVTRAVVPPAAQALMVRYDSQAIHYEIVPS